MFLILYPFHENSTTGFGVTFSNVSWVMEFLTYGYKISLILSNKYASRKLMNFVNWHKASYLKWVSFEFSKSIVFFKNRVYYMKNIFFSFFDIDQQLLKKSCFANLKFGGTLLSKTMPNFCRPHTMSIYKRQQLP